MSSLRAVLALAFLVGLPALAQDGEPALLLSWEAPDKLEPEQEQRYKSLASQPETLEARIGTLKASLADAQTLQVNLFPKEADFIAVRDGLDSDERGTLTWRGHIEGFSSEILLVSQGQEVTGYVRVNYHQEDPTVPPEGGEEDDPPPYGDLRTDFFTIDSLGGGLHVVRRLETAVLDKLQCSTQEDGKEASRYSTALESLKMAQQAAVPCITNVLVVYTPAAQAAHGNVPQLAQLAVAQANAAYANSQINNLHLNLVGARQVSYTEANSMTGTHVTDLVRLANGSDGFMDIVQTWRTELGADVVVLINASLPSGIAGEADAIMATPQTAFAVVVWNAAVGNLSFAHEVGHLQGARHNPEADGNTSPFPHGHGAQRPSYHYRTVMAYPCSGNCPRVPYFSNPDVNYNGRKTGDSSQRNNARVLRDTSCTVSNFMSNPLLGWKFLWGNGGNGALQGWYIGPADKYAVGDFDGDGADELFAANASSHYAAILDYAGSSWSTQWSNMGSNAIDWWLQGSNDRFVAGDFIPGNGRDELLAINPSSHYAHLMVYSGGVWSTVWSNLGSNAIDWWLLGGSDRYLVGSFDASAPGEQLLAVSAASGYSHLMKFNGSGWTTTWSNLGSGAILWWYLGLADSYPVGDFNPGNGVDELEAINPNGWSHTNVYVSGAWNGLWSNGGSGTIHWWWIGPQDSYVAGNFIAGNGRDEVLAMAQNNGWSHMMAFNGSSWQYQWGNSGNGSVGWWYINSGDRCFAGDFVTGNNRDELLCIQPSNGWSHLYQYGP